MRIQHNIMAMNSYRNFTNNTKSVSKNLEKLSSGYRINNAGDDAAGLAVSEKMRAQITGLKAAQKNAKDGISLVKTAEGALTEVHSMLNRMVDLATQSANGTFDNAVDRDNLQKEVSALKEEIDRIADSSNFNGIKLLDGSLNAKSAPTVNATNELAGGVPAADVSGALGTTLLAKPADTSDVKAKFEVDLSQYSLGVTGASAGTDGGTFNLTIGGQAGTATAHLDAGNYDGTALATAWATANATITIDSVEYTVTRDGAKLTFEQTNAPSVDGATSTGNMTVAAGATLAGAGTVTPMGDVNDGATVITAGHVPEDRVYANTSFTLNKANMADGNKLTIGDKTYVFKAGTDSKTVADTAKGEVLVDLTAIDDADSDYVQKAVNELTNVAGSNSVFTVGQSSTAGQVTLLEKTTNTVGLDTIEKVNAQVKLSKSGTLSAEDAASKALTLQIGDTADSYNKMKVDIGDMHVDALGIDGISIATQEGASAAIDAIKSAINTVSSTRGDLGALQNRLDHTINNLSVMHENIQDAEATIRDTDVADEMMAYTKNNILMQSAQAMLAQANQVPQGVLQLLG